MVRKKISFGFIMMNSTKIIMAALALVFFAAAASHATVVKARSDEPNAIIEGMHLNQVGGDLLVIEIRGTKMKLPKVIQDGASSLVLEWKGIRFPRDTDKQDWWDEYGWDIFKIDRKKSDEWWQKYDFPLVQRVQVKSADHDAIRMTVTGERPLKMQQIRGMEGSDLITLMLQAVPDITPPAQPAPRIKTPGDPLGMSSPVTLELRDVSAREVFRMLAKLRSLNLVLDATVPDSPMTFSFKNAKFSEVFAYMLRMNNLTYSLMGKTLVVGTSESIGNTLGKNETREYKIAYGDVAKLPAMIIGIVPLAKPPVVDERRRSLFITAMPEQHIAIEAFLNRVDHPGKQVMLQARLIEINDDAKQEIESMITSVYNGWLFSYGSSGMTTEYTQGNSLVTPNVLTSTSSSGNSSKFPIPGTSVSDASIPVNIANSAMRMLDASLTAMESDNKGKVLANPSVVALDGQKAQIKLTTNYQYQSGVDESRNPKFSTLETGPTLEITPLIGRDGFVTLKLKIKTGEIITFRKSGSSEMPENTNREVDTQIRVRNGEMFVIGGLFTESKTKNTTRVPILGQIPLLGELFKTRSDKHIKSEMAFVVVPYILDVPTGAAETFGLPSTSLMQ